MRYRKLGLLLGLAVIAVAVVGTASAASSSKSGSIPVISDSQLQANFTEIGGGSQPLPTDRTIPHWFGSTLDPHDGITYGYSMVGADPNACSGSACSTTIQADITPLIVNVGGLTFDGTSVVQATLASPQFALNDYGSTPAATSGAANVPRGAGGVLSQGDAGNQLQLEDATMRAQFNQTGASNYHVILHPNVMPAVTINVPANQGTLLQSGRGVIFADINISWWAAQIQNLESTADPTHLPIYLTDSVLLHIGPDPLNCCVIGFHGTKATGNRLGNGKSNGNTKMQTFAWASWVRPGIYARPNGGTDWALQDIHALSHEIAEWGDDPFVDNLVEPWLTPTAPQYGCTNILETGDPVVAIGFSMGTNAYDQTPNPWTSPTNHTPSVSYDGTYHPEDEVFLPWYMRTSPNTISEPVQGGTDGRYTLMGNLNRFAGFGAPATGC
ncbi:MAG TPA: hypothetical protein VJQ07_08790 [Gaiellaceae bacterium]|jgi:hypothetical protein|nr:hypothetical protein [Gaiellaceae bacterium]